MSALLKTILPNVAISNHLISFLKTLYYAFPLYLDGKFRVEPKLLPVTLKGPLSSDLCLISDFTVYSSLPLCSCHSSNSLSSLRHTQVTFTPGPLLLLFLPGMLCLWIVTWLTGSFLSLRSLLRCHLPWEMFLISQSMSADPAYHSGLSSMRAGVSYSFLSSLKYSECLEQCLKLRYLDIEWMLSTSILSFYYLH